MVKYSYIRIQILLLLNNNLPKNIWFLWLQGLDAAPEIVKKCYASWQKHNPGWNVVFLDELNLREYIDLKKRDITKQALSDIIRMNLLAKYGGVWIDATCFCTKPLDEWLYDYMQSGFFAFDKPNPERMIASWFLAGDRYNYIVQASKSIVNAYWDENPGMRYIGDTKWRFLSNVLDQLGKDVWFSRFVTCTLKVHPYFWLHYLFERVYMGNKDFNSVWDNTPKLSADIPHTLFFAGIYNPLTDELKAFIDDKTAPLHKLTWKVPPPENLDGTVIEYLFRT